MSRTEKDNCGVVTGRTIFMFRFCPVNSSWSALQAEVLVFFVQNSARKGIAEIKEEKRRQAGMQTHLETKL